MSRAASVQTLPLQLAPECHQGLAPLPWAGIALPVPGRDQPESCSRMQVKQDNKHYHPQRNAFFCSSPRGQTLCRAPDPTSCPTQLPSQPLCAPWGTGSSPTASSQPQAIPAQQASLALHPGHMALLRHRSSLGAWRGMPGVQQLQGLSCIEAKAFSSRPHSTADSSVTLKPSTNVSIYSKNHGFLLSRCFVVLQCPGEW